MTFDWNLAKEELGARWQVDDEDPLRLYFLPTAPGPVAGPTGRPIAQLMLLGANGGTLQLEASLALSPEAHQRAREIYAERLEVEPPALILSPAPLPIRRCRLVRLAQGDQEELTIAEIPCSGVSPWSAAFSVEMEPELLAQVQSAFTGVSGIARVEYPVEMQRSWTGTCVLSGPAEAAAEHLGEDATEADAVEAVKEEVSLGSLRVELGFGDDEAEEAPPELGLECTEVAVEQAASALMKLHGAGEARGARLEARVQKSVVAQQVVALWRDLASWLPEGESLPVLGITSSVTEDVGEHRAAPSEREIRLGFARGDEWPVAFVRLGQGEARATLSGDSTSLKAGDPSAPLTVITSYTDGGEDFVAELAPDELPSDEGEPWVLSPRDLGLAEIRVDGRAAFEAGSRKARVRIQYTPSGDGVEEVDRTVYLRKHDDWDIRMVVITRSADLGGRVVVDWKETRANGDVRKERFESDSEPRFTVDP